MMRIVLLHLIPVISMNAAPTTLALGSQSKLPLQGPTRRSVTQFESKQSDCCRINCTVESAHQLINLAHIRITVTSASNPRNHGAVMYAVTHHLTFHED